MKQLQFFGFGDDTFGGGSTNPADGEFYHDNFASQKPIVYRIVAGKQSLYVVGQCGHGAVQ
jgi:hypothetical protein